MPDPSTLAQSRDQKLPCCSREKSWHSKSWSPVTTKAPFASSLVSFLPFRCYRTAKESYILWVLEHWAEPAETWEDIINVFLAVFSPSFHHTSVLPCLIPAMTCRGQNLVSPLPSKILISAPFAVHPLAEGIMGTKSPIWGTKFPFWIYQFWCLFAGIKWTLVTCWIQPSFLAKFFLVTVKCKLIHYPNCAWGRYWHRTLSQREMFAPVHHLHHTWSFSWRYLWVFYVRTSGEGLGMENVAVRLEWFRYPWRHEITLHCHQHKEITLYKNN